MMKISLVRFTALATLFVSFVGCGATRTQLQSSNSERLRLEKELKLVKQEKLDAELAHRDLLHRLDEAEKQLANTTNELAALRLRQYEGVADPTGEPAPFVAPAAPAVAGHAVAGQAKKALPSAPAKKDGWQSR